MTFQVKTRRSLAVWLALCFLAQMSWLDSASAVAQTAAHRGQQLLAPAHRTTLTSGKGASAGHSTHWLPRMAAAPDDFRPQAELSILSRFDAAGLAQRPEVTSRFGRAPPPHIS